MSYRSQLLFPMRLALMTVVAGVLVTSAAHAITPEQQCQKGRYTAATKYAACQLKASAKFYGSGVLGGYGSASAKCTAKYASVWTRLATKALGTGASCDNPRFTDNGDGTVIDRLTGLRWEKKTNSDTVVNLGDPHDADNTYTWNAGSLGFTAGDGDVYTSFLTALNGGCFASQCDWRLPTLAELQTIVLAPPPCGIVPCIDAVFGPTSVDKHWSTTSSPVFPTDAWYVEFNGGSAYTLGKHFGSRARAVRGGF